MEKSRSKRSSPNAHPLVGDKTRPQKWSVCVEMGVLILSAMTLSSCLEVERAQDCNRLASQIRGVFRAEVPLTKTMDIEPLTRAMDELAKNLGSSRDDKAPAAAQLQILKKELRNASVELRRWKNSVRGASPEASDARLRDSIHRLSEAAKAFAQACH
jgi:hypothetical protein